MLQWILLKGKTNIRAIKENNMDSKKCVIEKLNPSVLIDPKQNLRLTIA